MQPGMVQLVQTVRFYRKVYSMEQYLSICQHLYEATRIPALLVVQDGYVAVEWSRFSKNAGAGIRL